MIRLETFFKNHFDTKEISDNNIRKFTEVHLQKLAAKNGGGDFTQMITETTDAYNLFFGKINDEDTKFAVQQGLTIAMNTAVENFKAAVSRRSGLILSVFGKESPEYQEFFPLGLVEYSGATLKNVETLMNRMVTASTKYTAELTAAVSTEFQGYLTTYTAARTAQLLKKGEVTDAKSATSQNRDVVEVQLMKNWLTIASMFVGDFSACNDFFDQSFIRSTQDDGEGETPEEPTE